MTEGTITITGVSGLVGANMARTLLAEGRQVRGVIHHEQRAIEGLEIELVQADVCDLDSLLRAFSGAWVVYHLAAYISLEMNCWAEVEPVNVQGVRNVVEACLRCGVEKLVHFSSIHALQQQPYNQPVDENRPLATADHFPPYDRSKALGEIEIQRGIARGLHAVILYPTAMIGPHDYYPSYFGKALLSLVMGRIPALVSGGFDWVDVRDVVAAAIQAEKTAASGSRYLLSGHWRSVKQVAELAARFTGTKPPRLSVPLSLAYLAAPLMYFLAKFNGSQPVYTRVTLDALRSNQHISHEKASRELRYQPRPFEETIFDTLVWFCQNGYLEPVRSLQRP
jgi:dihydroflavonol-4-reductase